MRYTYRDGQPQLWTANQCAAFLQVTPDQLRRLRRRGQGPSYTRQGRAVMYEPEAVARWIKQQTRMTTKDKTTRDTK